ncbi:5'-AMP-activated protein kinase catalytic subunit alpha-2 [Tritrichomonas foetus]|uniref:non-specific serine/threonine protein kinase n=1 Tax=Tritrichomonas foetus TaxID=1144522 RepID=A0A1J4JV00_9EUKA|nr:5'-AMP-activated protein kinase catalytic subunit alpha-2 [Tritrichomonas foetus]|eukprot:OHT01085.1 5'-AMP-activated protein kinase catalytic subunit alpha-2 [Tritrichomonas foetus]
MEGMPKIPHTIGNYVLKRQIGKGSFATVWRAEHRIAKKFVAIKVIENSNVTDESSRTKFVREINLIKRMDHPFIARLFEVIETPELTFLIQEYVENGSILNYVNLHGNLSEKQARRYFSQIISAVEYLHDVVKVAHRDLKAENVLLDKNLNARLIDFGLSNTFSDEQPELSTACGSPAYAAPEMVRGMPYTKMADIWSAGVLLYAMVTGTLPFDDDNVQMMLQKIAYTEPSYPSNLSLQLIDLLKKILVKNPDQRATIKKIREHPWFSQSEYSHLKLDLSTDDSLKVRKIDREIVEELNTKGIDTNRLSESLLLDEINEDTAIYSILRREKITGKIKEMMLSLNAHPSQTFRISTSASVENVAVKMPTGRLRKPSPRKLPVPKKNDGNEPVSNVPKIIKRPTQPDVIEMRRSRLSIDNLARVPIRPPLPSDTSARRRSMCLQ